MHDVGFLVIELSAKLAEVILLLGPLDFNGRFQVALLLLLVLDGSLFALNLKPERTRLSIQLLLLLFQNEKCIEQALN